MSTKPKYPDASENAKKYKDLSEQLSNSYRFISSCVDKARNVCTDALELSDADGEYYNVYIAKLNDWISLHSEQIGKLDTFLNELSECIASADNLANTWTTRINEKEDDN